MVISAEEEGREIVEKGDAGEATHAPMDNSRSRQTAKGKCRRFFTRPRPLLMLRIAYHNIDTVATGRTGEITTEQRTERRCLRDCFLSKRAVTIILRPQDSNEEGSSMTIGERIRTLRLENHMTQERLARQLKISPQTVSKWEKDITAPDILLLGEIFPEVLFKTICVYTKMLLKGAFK